MLYLTAACFFTLLLIGAVLLILFTVQEHEEEFLTALAGDMPRRRTARAFTKVIRVTVQPRPAAAPARRRAAA